ncbi:apoptotic chromatin condensation inducer in the nucleus [Klebsormidium nitens]|uniref:Apoptotic chromatin condensation inducer in the nucleus n=1 Tax=Klebsormidium nitens TaxID=105231 RepID=A0A0U9HKG1_KLENI|nr:apoptotic chromatin condensation inducer in the nucleus [Klebsormidium nitens]|eukprot:GAQ83039.1 apoptotic chromatin condensation inducer in the nucleus [Klebsormidium nitens]
MDQAQIGQLKVAELKEELKKRGLPLKGLKAELAERLSEAVRQESQPVLIESEQLEAEAKTNTVADQDGAADDVANQMEIAEIAKKQEDLSAEPEMVADGKATTEDPPVLSPVAETLIIGKTEKEQQPAEADAHISARGPFEIEAPAATAPEDYGRDTAPALPAENGSKEDAKPELHSDTQIEDTRLDDPKAPEAGPAEVPVGGPPPEAPSVEKAGDLLKPEASDGALGPSEGGGRAEGEALENAQPKTVEQPPTTEHPDRSGVDTSVPSSSAMEEEQGEMGKEPRRESGVKRSQKEDGRLENGGEKEGRPAKFQKVEAAKERSVQTSKPVQRHDSPDKKEDTQGKPAEQEKSVRPADRTQTRPIARLAIRSNGEAGKRDVPASARPATRSVRVNNLVRPFTERALRALLSETGTIEENGFWMDSIKTHCFVMFKSVEDAVRTREALFNLQWPPLGGKHLVVSFVAESEVESRVKGAAVPPPPNAAAAASRSAGKEEAAKGTASQRVVLPVKERLTLPVAEKPVPVVAEPAMRSLDDLFRKTTAKPCIYWLPLTEEQVKEQKQKEENAPPGKGTAA